MTDANNSDPFADHNEQINPLDYAKTKFNKDGEIDLEGLARGKYEADKHISRLEAELAEVRRKAEQGMAMKDLLEAIKSNPSGTVEPPINPPVVKDPAANPVDVETVVREALTKAELERFETNNKQIVVSKLNEVWGDNVGIELRKASSALGISVTELEAMGKKSPQALFRLLGVDAPVRAPSGTAVPTSTNNISSNRTGVRDQKYYSELRRSNPKLYNDPKTQAQELRDAIEMGAAFFNN